jgi:hypothetical protein
MTGIGNASAGDLAVVSIHLRCGVRLSAKLQPDRQSNGIVSLQHVVFDAITPKTVGRSIGGI